MNYHRAVKQWNTLGGQQKKRVGLDEVWAMPRRGTPAQAEVKEFMEEKAEPVPRLKMRKPKTAPKVENPSAEKRIISDKVAESKKTGKPVLFNMGPPKESAFGRAVREVREAQARKK